MHFDFPIMNSSGCFLHLTTGLGWYWYLPWLRQSVVMPHELSKYLQQKGAQSTESQVPQLFF